MQYMFNGEPLEGDRGQANKIVFETAEYVKLDIGKSHLMEEAGVCHLEQTCLQIDNDMISCLSLRPRKSPLNPPRPMRQIR